MSEEWYYRSGDVVQGPVSFETLVKAYAIGTLKSDQTIRRRAGDWFSVGTFRRIVVAKDAYLDQHRADSTGQQLQTAEPGEIEAVSAELARHDIQDSRSWEQRPVGNTAGDLHNVPAPMGDSIDMLRADEDTVIQMPVDQDLASHPWYQFLLTRIAAIVIGGAAAFFLLG